MQPLIDAWLGEQAGRAALYGVLLTCAYGLSVAHRGPARLPARGRQARARGALRRGHDRGQRRAHDRPRARVRAGRRRARPRWSPMPAVRRGSFARLHRVVPRRAEPARPGPVRVVAAAVVTGAAAAGWALLAADVLPRWAALAAIGARGGGRVRRLRGGRHGRAPFGGRPAGAAGPRPRGPVDGPRRGRDPELERSPSCSRACCPPWRGRPIATSAPSSSTTARPMALPRGCSPSGPTSRCSRWRDNVGFAPAVNRGVAAGEEDYVALLNNDMELDPGWLAALVQPWTPTQTRGCRDAQAALRERPRALGRRRRHHRVDRRRHPAGIGELDRGQYDHGGRVFSACAGAALYRRAALREVGPFDEYVLRLSRRRRLGVPRPARRPPRALRPRGARLPSRRRDQPADARPGALPDRTQPRRLPPEELPRALARALRAADRGRARPHAARRDPRAPGPRGPARLASRRAAAARDPARAPPGAGDTHRAIDGARASRCSARPAARATCSPSGRAGGPAADGELPRRDLAGARGPGRPAPAYRAGGGGDDRARTARALRRQPVQHRRSAALRRDRRAAARPLPPADADPRGRARAPAASPSSCASPCTGSTPPSTAPSSTRRPTSFASPDARRRCPSTTGSSTP